MRHTYDCPMRWADMDLLGHVNNVRYLDYLAEARLDLFAEAPAGWAPVTLHKVQFLSPLVFHRAPVKVDTWVVAVHEDSFSLAHEVYDESDGQRTVYLRASSELAHRLDQGERSMLDGLQGPDHEWRPVASQQQPPRSSYAVKVRRSDVDVRGNASDVVHFEYFQEARIRYLMDLHTRGEEWGRQVIARTDVHLRAPVPLREEEYAVHSWIAHLGTKSFTIGAELLDGETVLASSTTVVVAFDPATQRAAEMPDSQHVRLAEELVPQR